MSKSRILLSTCVLAGFALGSQFTMATEIERPYLGLDYALYTYENANANASDAEPSAIRLRAGSVVAKYLAVEAHLAVGAGDDDIKITTIGGTTAHKISSPIAYGVFVRPQIALGALSLYALGGYSYVEFELSPAPAAWSDNTTSTKDFSFGGGVQIDLGNNLGVNASYIQYVEGLSAVSGGLMYRF